MTNLHLFVSTQIRPLTITKIIDSINMDSTIAGSVNDNINMDSTIAGSVNALSWLTTRHRYVIE